MAYIKRSYTHATGTFATSGNNTIITGVTGKQIIIKDLVVQNESSTDTTVLIKNDDVSVVRGLLEGKQALNISFMEGEELVLDLGKSLVVNLDGANSHGYSVRYYFSD